MKAQTEIPKITPFVFNGTNRTQTTHDTPDSNGAASYNHYVEFINGAFSIYDKNTGNQIGSTVDAAEFWSRAGVTADYTLDPRIAFIPQWGAKAVWVVAQINYFAQLCIATTDPSDVFADPSLGRWRGATFAMTRPDFTMLGYDTDGLYIAVNGSDHGAQSEQSTTSDKGKGDGKEEDRMSQLAFIPLANVLAYPPKVGPSDIFITELLPPQTYGTGLFPTSDTSGAGWQYQTFIGVDLNSKRHLTWVLYSHQFDQIISQGTIEVEKFIPLYMGSCVRQPEDHQGIWASYGMPQIGSTLYNDGFNIWLAHTVQDESYAKRIRWYRLYIDPVTRMPGLAAWGEIYHPALDYFNPSIYSFGENDYTVISCSRSGIATNNPLSPNCGNIGAYAVVFKESNPKNMEIVPLKAGQSDMFAADGGSIKWGDYSTICKDPDLKTHPRRLWAINQYVIGTNGTPTRAWGTIIAAMDIPNP